MEWSDFSLQILWVAGTEVVSPILLVKRQLSQTWFHGGSLWIASLRILSSSLFGFIMRSELTLFAAALLDFFSIPLSSWAGSL